MAPVSPLCWVDQGSTCWCWLPKFYSLWISLWATAMTVNRIQQPQGSCAPCERGAWCGSSALHAWWDFARSWRYWRSSASTNSSGHVRKTWKNVEKHRTDSNSIKWFWAISNEQQPSQAAKLDFSTAQLGSSHKLCLTTYSRLAVVGIQAIDGHRWPLSLSYTFSMFHCSDRGYTWFYTVALRHCVGTWC